MASTIQSYKEVLEQTENSAPDSELKAKLMERIRENDEIIQKKGIMQERNKNAELELKKLKEKQLGKEKEADQLKAQIQEMKHGKGVTKDKYNGAKVKRDQLKEEILVLEKKIEKETKAILEEERKAVEERDKVQTEKDQLTAFLKHQEQRHDEIRDKLNEAEKQLRFAKRKLEDADSVKGSESKILEENEGLEAMIEVLTDQWKKIVQRQKEIAEQKKKNEETLF